MKNNTKRIWSLLCKAHNINKLVLKGTEPTEEELFFYEQKDALLTEVCNEVLHTSIKVGWSCSGYNHIIYFELGDKQLSFHSIYGNYGLPVELKDAIRWDGITKDYAVPDDDDNYPGLYENRPKARKWLPLGEWPLKTERRYPRGRRREFKNSLM